MRMCAVTSAVLAPVLSWLAMQIVHELGHVAGAWATGGTINQLVLHPLAISRTDVAPNPRPAVVVWLGPLGGCVIPLGLWLIVRTLAHRNKESSALRSLANGGLFFLGFCLIANGAYLAFGTADRVGDCGEMLRTGSPAWLLYAVGVVATLIGFLCWHRLGSLKDYLTSPSRTASETTAILAATLLVIAMELSWSR